MVRTILAALAELEADLIAERTREAMAAFKAGTRTTRSGRPVGRPRKVTSEIQSRVAELRASGLKWREVAVRVHLPVGTLRKLGTVIRREKPRAEYLRDDLERPDARTTSSRSGTPVD